MTTQTVSGRRYFTKAWLMEQKSLIALLVLIAIVSTLSPNFFTISMLGLSRTRREALAWTNRYSEIAIV